MAIQSTESFTQLPGLDQIWLRFKKVCPRDYQKLSTLIDEAMSFDSNPEAYVYDPRQEFIDLLIGRAASVNYMHVHDELIQLLAHYLPEFGPHFAEKKYLELVNRTRMLLNFTHETIRTIELSAPEHFQQLSTEA